MPTYSNSKLNCFENCPLQFSYRYIEKIPTDIESIEAFMGKRVHEALDWLYQRVGEGHVPELPHVVDHYNALWDEAWHRLVHIPRKKRVPDDYRRKGVRCIESYYKGNWPFDADRTLALETEVTFALDDDVLFRGYVDRVARGRGGELVIHDYKTSGTMPRRAQLMSDLQLAIYQLGAAERWPGSHPVHLVWHFLTFARRVTIQLNSAIDAKRRILARRVAAIEASIGRGDMPPRESALCNWCSYRPICPAQEGARERELELVLDPTTIERRRSDAERLERAGQLKLM